MIRNITQSKKRIKKIFGLVAYFQVSQQKKIYEGLVLTEKLKYTAKDNLEYTQLYRKSHNLNNLQEKNDSKYVNRMLLSSIFSRIIGSNLSLSIYLTQKIQILKDLPLDTEIEGRVTVARSLGKDRYLLITEVQGLDEKGEKVKYLQGQARIMLKQ